LIKEPGHAPGFLFLVPGNDRSGSQSAYVVKAANRPKAGVGRGPRSVVYARA